MTILPLSKLRTDGGTQPRATLDMYVIEEYTEAMEAGAKFPPVDVFFDGTDYWLADGFHREKATFGAGKDEIACTIHQGTLDDAKWFSYAANKANGLYRSNEDKQRAVKAALGHPKGAGMSDNQIAKHVGVDHVTVANWREKLTATCEIHKSTKRTGLDGRTTNVSNIGRRGSGSTQVVRPVVAHTPEPPAVPDAPEPKPAPVLVPPPPPPLPPAVGPLDPEDVAEAQRIVHLCEQITQSNLSARDLRFVLSNVPWQQKAIETIEEACEYLQSSIGTAAVAADALSRN